MGNEKKPDRSRLFVFILGTFILSWAGMLLPAQAGNGERLLQRALPPLGMLIPAFVGLVIELFATRDSLIYFRTYKEKPRWVLCAYLVLTLLVGSILLLAAWTSLPTDGLVILGNVLFILWTLLVIRLYRQSGEVAFRRAGLSLGDTQMGLRFVVGFVLFLLLQPLLNWIFGLGEPQGLQATIEGIPVPEPVYLLALVTALALAIVGGPLGSLAGAGRNR